jgi:hypothetical protein
MKKQFLIAGTIVLSCAAPSRAQPGDLQLTIGNGRVTLLADNVPVRTILQEWARQGRSQIVNADKVSGPPVTLRLIDVPEEQALDVVLRSVSGYLAAPRSGLAPNASRFDRIMILASSRPTTAAPPPAAQQPSPQPYPNFPVQPPVMEVEDDQMDTDPNDPKPQQLPAASDQPGPIQVTPPDEQEMPQPGQPGQPPMQQQLPLTSPRPGLIAPQPQPPVRRPGGDRG